MWLLTLLVLAILAVSVLTLACVIELDSSSGLSSFDAEAEIRRQRNQTIRDLFEAEAAAQRESSDIVEGTAREVWRP